MHQEHITSDYSSAGGSESGSDDEAENDERALGLQRLACRPTSSSEASAVHAKKRKPKMSPIQKTLAIVLVSLQGSEVVVEMKNGVEVTGIIEECDTNMNLTLHNARQVNMEGEVREMDIAFVSGSSILYVHMAPTLDVRSNLSKYVMQDINILLIIV
jgi:small nuclear ribonucleoprotein (snRNP)-like protein